jgi:cyclopropane fatty-acyl-phospholipid synthase-like methyltransferase
VTRKEVVRKVATGYDSIAGQYFDLVNRPRASDVRPQWLDGLLERLFPGSKVLDLGCGPGVPTAEMIVSNGHDVVGIDISPEQIKLARANVPQGHFDVCDALEAQFDPSSFDAVLTLFVMTHLPREEWAALLSRLGEWLVPGGWLLATFGMSDSDGCEEENFLGFGHQNWTNGYDGPTSLELLSDAGFRIERAEVIEDELPSGPERWLWVMSQFGTRPSPL